MASGNGHQVSPSMIAVAAGLGEQTPLLAAILAELRSGALEVGVSDALGREMILNKFPVTGAKRALAYRTGNGFDALNVTTTGVLALPANEARLGLTISNAGANPVILYLADGKRAGVPAIWLGTGATWDGRVGNVAWAGNVFAVATTATSTLAGGEI
jgi:hypothetical protein